MFLKALSQCVLLDSLPKQVSINTQLLESIQNYWKLHLIGWMDFKSIFIY
jgi:hypothetical protein